MIAYDYYDTNFEYFIIENVFKKILDINLKYLNLFLKMLF